MKIPFAKEGKLKTFSDKIKKIHCQSIYTPGNAKGSC